LAKIEKAAAFLRGDTAIVLGVTHVKGGFGFWRE
jgi:sigma54-dependent transcription regulator